MCFMSGSLCVLHSKIATDFVFSIIIWVYCCSSCSSGFREEVSLKALVKPAFCFGCCEPPKVSLLAALLP